MQAAGSYIDSGRTPKNLTTGSATLTQTAGGWGCSFNGSSQYLAAASVADWQFMQQQAYTLGIVVYSGFVQPTTWGGAGTPGMFTTNPGGPAAEIVMQGSSGALIYRAGAAAAVTTGKQVVVFRVSSPTKNSTSPSTTFDWGAAYVNGLRVGHRASTWTANATPVSLPLQIGKAPSTGAFLAGAFLDFFVDDREWGDDEIQAYTSYWHWKLDQI
jgi:hypothetical protein